MKNNYSKSFFGGALAIILGTSCCWISALAVWIGGSVILTFISQFVGQYKYTFLLIGGLLFIIGIYQLVRFRQKRKTK